MFNIDIPLQAIKNEITLKHRVDLYVLRLDLINKHISGNKWFKLKYNIELAKEQGKSTILTFGGAYSNHIAATAYAGKLFGFKTIGIIRGEETIPLNHTLSFAKECGMDIHYVSRKDYKGKNQESFVSDLRKRYGDFYTVPEGGANAAGAGGCEEIIFLLNNKIKSVDYVCCACGTGTTMAGIVAATNKDQKTIGFSSLKGKDTLTDFIKGMLPNLSKEEKVNSTNWDINFNYHFGGYAKYNKELISFINDFYLKYSIPLDFIYEGKMLYGIYDLMKQNHFSKGSTVVAIHGGGLQGNKGLPEGTFVF